VTAGGTNETTGGTGGSSVACGGGGLEVRAAGGDCAAVRAGATLESGVMLQDGVTPGTGAPNGKCGEARWSGRCSGW
jgi:hypothetical protein